MAATVTIADRAPNSILYRIEEDGTAADLQSRDVAADLIAPIGAGVAGPPQPGSAILDAVSPTGGFADQAAAQGAFYANFDLDTYTPTAAAPTSMQGDANVSAPAVDGNFRLELTAVKTADADVNIYHVRLSLRHSVID